MNQSAAASQYRRQPDSVRASNGPYANASNQDMLTLTMDGLVERYDLDGLGPGRSRRGRGPQAQRDFNLTRETVLGRGWRPETPAYDVSRHAAPGSRR